MHSSCFSRRRVGDKSVSHKMRRKAAPHLKIHIRSRTWTNAVGPACISSNLCKNYHAQKRDFSDYLTADRDYMGYFNFRYIHRGRLLFVSVWMSMRADNEGFAWLCSIQLPAHQVLASNKTNVYTNNMSFIFLTLYPREPVTPAELQLCWCLISVYNVL